MKLKVSYTSIDTFNSPLGTLYLIFSGEALAVLDFRLPQGMAACCLQSVKIADACKIQLDKYFSGSLRRFDLDTVFLFGTELEQKIWHSLNEIPYGETRTYKWIAERVGRPNAVRAAGNALGKNPLPVIFPCHRIIASDGSIGGYTADAATAGSELKRWLLRHEDAL